MATSDQSDGLLKAAGRLIDLGQGLAGKASDAARQAALKLVQASLGRTHLTVPLPSVLLNQGLRRRMSDHPHIDHLSVTCGDDRLGLKIDGHVQRAIFTLDIALVVLSCEITPTHKVLRVRQVREALDVQLRQVPVLVNWAARHAGRQAFRLANHLPIPSLTQQLVAHVPGLSRVGHREWALDLVAAGCMDILEDRDWLAGALPGLPDLSQLPGMPLVRERRDALQQLVGQFTVQGVRVRPGRLDVDIGLRPG